MTRRLPLPVLILAVVAVAFFALPFIGLLWRATQDAPDAAQLKMRLVRPGGEVAQESTLPLLGGRLIPSALRAGNVVRDEQTVVIGAGVPSEVLTVTVDVLDAHGAAGGYGQSGLFTASRLDASFFIRRDDELRAL